MSSQEDFNEQRERLARELLDISIIPDHCLMCPVSYLKASAYARIAMRDFEGLVHCVKDEFETAMSKCKWNGNVDNRCNYPSPYDEQ